MLIRGESTEDRIAKIAQGFGQGAQNFMQMQDRQRARALQEEALKRQEAFKALEVSNSLSEKTGKLVTPDLVAPMLKSGDFTGLGDILKSAPQTQKSIQALEDRQIERDYKKSQIEKNLRASPKENLTYAQKLEIKAQKEAEAANNPNNKLKDLGAEGRSKVGSIASGLQAIDQMVKASEDGLGPKYIDPSTAVLGRFISDDPYTEAERTAAEVVGRLQSGGAMSEDEVKTFKALGPRAGDDKATKQRKLTQQRDFLQNKLTAFSMKPEDLVALGFQTESKYAPRTKPAGKSPGANYSQQHVQAIKQMSDEELLRFVQGG
jgi:hypothetical protein